MALGLQFEDLGKEKLLLEIMLKGMADTLDLSLTIKVRTIKSISFPQRALFHYFGDLSLLCYSTCWTFQ